MLKNSLYKEAALNGFLETANPVLLHRAVLQLLKSLSETEYSPLEELKEGMYFSLVHWLYNVPHPLERAQTAHYCMQVLTAGISHRG